MSNNRELARMFREIALMYELEEVQWKPRAYREAAYGIEGLSRDVKDIYNNEGKDGLEDIPGVGSSIADHIIEFLKTGRIKKFEKFRKKYPEGITELVSLHGLGPKSVKKLLKKLDVSEIDEIKDAARKGKIRKIRGFGPKTEENILEAFKAHKTGTDRMMIHVALGIAEEVVDALKPVCKDVQYVGSLRRWRATIGDIDILAISGKPKKVMDRFLNMKAVKKVLQEGSTRSAVMLKEQDVRVDVRVVDRSSAAAALQYFTGSKEHSVALRKIAIKKGYKLSEYGLFRKKSGKKLPLKSEKALYNKLGLDYIPPEMRENRGELELAQEHRVPSLVELGDIKGDFHTHTNYSDGHDTLKLMVKAAKDRGYKFVTISDHSVSSRIAGGMDSSTLRRQMNAIDKLAKKIDIRIFKGAEVDILKDGSLDYSDRLLKKLDVVVGGVHSSLKMSKDRMTSRIIAALDNEHLTILAHPTGRIIGKRPAYNVDFAKVCKKAADNNKVLEINCQPERLDLDGAHVLEAKRRGCKFSLGTDAKNVDDLELMKFGLGQARRGWLEKSDVINTYTFNKLKKFI